MPTARAEAPAAKIPAFARLGAARCVGIDPLLLPSIAPEGSGASHASPPPIGGGAASKPLLRKAADARVIANEGIGAAAKIHTGGHETGFETASDAEGE